MTNESPKPAGIFAGLGDLPEGAIVTEDGLAEMLDKCRMSIRRAVKRGELPHPTRMMGKRCWLAGAIVRHLNARLERAGQEAEQAARRIARLSV